YTALLKRRDYALCGNVSDERVLREWTTTKPAEGRIETPATCIICGENFLSSTISRAVQMHTNIALLVFARHPLHHAGDQIRGCYANGVCERDGSNSQADYLLDSRAHLGLIPRIAVRISERHRNINDHIEFRIVGLYFNRLQHLTDFFG